MHIVMHCILLLNSPLPSHRHGIANRSMFINDPNEAIMDGYSLKIPYTCGKFDTEGFVAN